MILFKHPDQYFLVHFLPLVSLNQQLFFRFPFIVFLVSKHIFQKSLILFCLFVSLEKYFHFHFFIMFNAYFSFEVDFHLFYSFSKSYLIVIHLFFQYYFLIFLCTVQFYAVQSIKHLKLIYLNSIPLHLPYFTKSLISGLPFFNHLKFFLKVFVNYRMCYLQLEALKIQFFHLIIQ